MKEYGYMEGGYLRSRFVDDKKAAELNDVWKPVDAIDDSRLTVSDGRVVVPVPYDAGDHIAYKYVERTDTGGVRQEIARLKQELTDSDYKVIKCYEASLLGDEQPYDIKSVHDERQTIRDRINDLESQL